jgi:hypothetical protein
VRRFWVYGAPHVPGFIEARPRFSPCGEPGCGAQPGASVPATPVLTAFAINGGEDTVSSAASTVALTHTVVGTTPSEISASAIARTSPTIRGTVFGSDRGPRLVRWCRRILSSGWTIAPGHALPSGSGNRWRRGENRRRATAVGPRTRREQRPSRHDLRSRCVQYIKPEPAADGTLDGSAVRAINKTWTAVSASTRVRSATLALIRAA